MVLTALLCYPPQAQQVHAMFPHVSLQAITLDLADTRSISLTVEHILNNAIYIPVPGTAGAEQPLNSLPIHTPAPSTPDSQAPSPPPLTASLQSSAGGEATPDTVADREGERDGAAGSESVVRRRRGPPESHSVRHNETDDTQSSSGVGVIRNNQSGAPPRDEGSTNSGSRHARGSVREEVSMSFSSLQRRKRELLASAKRCVYAYLYNTITCIPASLLWLPLSLTSAGITCRRISSSPLQAEQRDTIHCKNFTNLFFFSRKNYCVCGSFIKSFIPGSNLPTSHTCTTTCTALMQILPTSYDSQHHISFLVLKLNVLF